MTINREECTGKRQHVHGGRRYEDASSFEPALEILMGYPGGVQL